MGKLVCVHMNLEWATVNPISFLIQPTATHLAPARAMTETRALWTLLASQGCPVTKELSPELNPPNNRPVGHATHNLLVKDKKSKKTFLLVNAQASECDLKVAAKTLGQKEFRMADSAAVGVLAGCITSLSLLIAPEQGAGSVTVALDETLLQHETLLCCAGCDSALDHSQHNVCRIAPQQLLAMLSQIGTPILSLQTGLPLGAASTVVSAEPEEAKDEKEEQEEKTFQQKQLADVSAQIVKIEQHDKSALSYDFAHKVQYLKQHGAVMFERLLVALSSGAVLTSVYLGCNDLQSAGCMSVGRALETNTTLQHLYLQYNHIDDHGVEALSGLLGEGSVLKSLYLYGNDISCTGAQSLGAALQGNTSLLKLVLSQNYIGQQGGAALALSLLHNTTLAVLSLGMNPVGDSTASALARVLSEAPASALKFITLSGCRITDQGAQSLTAAISAASNALTLDLSASPNIGAAARAALLEAASQRREPVLVQIN